MTRTNALADFESKFMLRLQAEITASQGALTPTQTVAIAVNVLATVMNGISMGDLHFYAELRDMARYIIRAKREIMAIGSQEIAASHIPHATDQLKEVVNATEHATNRIMDSCDKIGALTEQCPPDVATQLNECTGEIFEACSFQDITGQRINKVVQTFLYIDDKVRRMTEALGIEGVEDGGNVMDALAKTLSDNQRAENLDGPALPGRDAPSQSDIDRLFEGKA